MLKDGFYDIFINQGYKNTHFPFSQTVFEASPLNRVMEQGAPGADWQPVPNQTTGHTMKLVYSTNIVNEVKLWTVTTTGAIGTTNYNANELYKTISKDENWKDTDLKAGTTEEFKDKEGRVVLKRVWETDAKSLNTYYVYDDLSNLRYVLPPAVNENGQALVSSFTDNDVNFNNFIYGYKYDGRRRLIEKKIPGKGWEYMVYNKLDQIVLTQDAIQRIANQWLFNKYDALGRPVVSGLYNDGSSRSILQSNIDQETANSHPLWEQKTSGGIGYTDDAYPRAIAYYHSISYYDDYDFPGGSTYPFTGKSNMTRGLPTGSKTTVLGSGNMLMNVIYYDDKGRALKTYSQHYLSGAIDVNNYDEATKEWNFDNSLENTTRVHHVGSNLTTIVNRYEYDHMGRKKTTTESINNATPTVLSELTYNEIGQLKIKSVGNNLNTTTFSYNKRGWLKTQDNDQALFSEVLW